jgi:hypothetical protein
VTVSFWKYLPWQVIHFLQCSTHFSKTCCRPVCRKVQEYRGTGSFDLGAPFLLFEKPRNRMGARSGLYGGCPNRVTPISVSASITNIQSRNADAQLRLLRHPKKGSFKTTVTPFSRSEWSVVRSASLAKGGTSKERPSPHLHKVPTRSNKVSPRTLQTALVYFFHCIYHESGLLMDNVTSQHRILNNDELCDLDS